MLRITIEILPADGGPTEPIGTVDVANDLTGTPELGNYDVTSRGADGSTTRTRLEGARRDAGAWALTADALAAVAVDRVLGGHRVAPALVIGEPDTAPDVEDLADDGGTRS